MTAINYDAMQIALRTHLVTLVVATTGSTTLSRTPTGYARTTGSFLDDNFARGMEVTPQGFPSNALATITNVTALTMTVNATYTVSGAAAARSLLVALPSVRSWENIGVTPTVGAPYVEEQFDPGTAFIPEIGTAARREARPIYSPRIYVPANTGIGADGRYSDAILELFRHGTVITCDDGTQLCVSSSPAPSKGARANDRAGWSAIPVNIPLYTLN